MVVPRYNEFYRSVLECLADEKVHSAREINEYCAEQFHLDDEDRAALLPSSNQTALSNRVGWARTYLKKAGLIASVKKAQFTITQAGKIALANPSLQIDNEYLRQSEDFRDFFDASRAVKKNDEKTVQDASVHGKHVLANTVSEKKGQKKGAEEELSSATPQERMDEAIHQINAQLADALLTNILNQDPSFFERLVIDLLEHMGYGGKENNKGVVTGKSGDQGIDGIINQDALGFDQIYVQAKRWSPSHGVGEPDVQGFIGAMLGAGAKRGLFITTSHFSDHAKKYAEKQLGLKLILVDGKRLTDLMIKYDLGVSTINTYKVKAVDGDYFDPEE